MPTNLKTPEDVLRAIKDNKIERIDLRVTDLPGRWHQVPVMPIAVGGDNFERGIAFDVSSLLGFQEIQEHDNMLAMPDPASAFRDPFSDIPTLALICNVRDPASGQNYARDPRSIAQKAEAYLQKMQIGDTANFGLELEHLLFRDDPDAAEPRRKTEPRSSASQGAMLRAKKARPVPPPDVLQDVRAQTIATLSELGIEVEADSVEAASGDQSKIDMHFTTLTRMADNVMIYKYVVANIARRFGLTENVKSLFGNSGPAMGVHQSIWVGGRPLFAGDGYAGSAALMRHYLAGLVEHAPALLAICAPMANSDRRLMPGFKAPVKLGYVQRNHPSKSRMPINQSDSRAKRVEFRCHDPSCNPYLAFAAMLMAGIDGFENRLYNLDPSEPIEKFYRLPPHELAKIPLATGEQNSLKALASDHAFLLKGDVFPAYVIEAQLNGSQA
jgi:glutamine synthetase